jgi:hypothetical protein
MAVSMVYYHELRRAFAGNEPILQFNDRLIDAQPLAMTVGTRDTLHIHCSCSLSFSILNTSRMFALTKNSSLWIVRMTMQSIMDFARAQVSSENCEPLSLSIR